jgi:hypothetical protein
MQASHSESRMRLAVKEKTTEIGWRRRKPSPAASLFINQGEHVGAFPCQPLQPRSTRAAIPNDAWSS